MELFSGYLGALLAILILSCFVKVATVLGILRFGLGLSGPAFGIVIFVVSIAFALTVIDPKLQSSGGVQLFAGRGTLSEQQLEVQFRPFLHKNTKSAVLQRFQGMTSISNHGEKELPFRVLLSAFLVSELQEAFRLGCIFLIPFVVIDLAVANIFMLLSVTQMSVQTLSLPLKILLFVAVDGWGLVAEKLLAAYG